MDTFGLKIIASDKVFYEGRCRKLTIPAPDGEMGLLPNHENMVIAITVGIARMEAEEDHQQEIALGQGFAEVVNNRVRLIVVTAERPEDIDVVAPDESPLSGVVTSVTFKGVHYEIIVDVAGFKWMIQSTDFQEEGSKIGLLLQPDDIHIMKKSEYSGMFGDYTTFSDEMDEDILASQREEAEEEDEI